MKTVDELMALADDYSMNRQRSAIFSVSTQEARAALLTALQEVTQPVAPHECKTEEEKTAYAFGWRKGIESVRMQPKCVCGENTLGVVHRADSPCYWPTEPHVAVAAIQPAQPVAQPSDEALLRQALKQLVKAAETMPCHFDDHFEAINALRARLKGDM